jgi:signal transduction histidine kinase
MLAVHAVRVARARPARVSATHAALALQSPSDVHCTLFQVGVGGAQAKLPAQSAALEHGEPSAFGCAHVHPPKRTAATTITAATTSSLARESSRCTVRCPGAFERNVDVSAPSYCYNCAMLAALARIPRLAWAVGAAVAAITAFAVLDEDRESQAALDDFAANESLSARLVAVELSQNPGAARAIAQSLADDGAKLLLLDRAATLHDVDGAAIDDPAFTTALHDRTVDHVRIPREEAPLLGFPRRTAFAGIARLASSNGDVDTVVVAASAERERDRERRAGGRLVVGVLLAGGLVAGFGAIALRRQRAELDLQRALAVSDAERRGEERLLAHSRAATLGTMALGIAHELSTPLSVIAGRADQILARTDGDERTVTAARAIVDQTERIGEVVRGFLALARGRAPAGERLAARAIVDGAVALVEHRYARANVSLDLDVDSAAAFVHGDARLLEQALVNLLLNACDACARGGRVVVRARLEGPTVELAVVDDGAGISPDDLLRVTEPFFTTKTHGTGLGLAVAREIAKAHHGTLTLAPNEIGRGTVATLALPERSDG